MITGDNPTSRFSFPYLELKYIAIDEEGIIEQPELNQNLENIIAYPELHDNRICLSPIVNEKIRNNQTATIKVGRQSPENQVDICIINIENKKKFISRQHFELIPTDGYRWMISDEISKSCTKVFRKKNQSELLINIQKKGIQYLEDRDSIRILSHYNQDKQAVYLCFTFMDNQ